MSDYRTYLTAIGRPPIPPHAELRTSRSVGDVELPATAKRWWGERSAMRAVRS